MYFQEFISSIGGTIQPRDFIIKPERFYGKKKLFFLNFDRQIVLRSSFGSSFELSKSMPAQRAEWC